jgi:hypothetical protein
MNMIIENDIVLIYLEDQPLVFARVESILPDSKPDWYHIQLLMLQVPLQLTTWILRDRYIGGDEFTMNGKRMRLEKVLAPEPPPAPVEKETLPEGGRKAKIISLGQHRKGKP